MCGRAYYTYSEEELYTRYLGRKPTRLTHFDPAYNLAPTQLSPVVLVSDKRREIKFFRWGLVPFWAQDVHSAAKYSLINAKAEEIETKRSYRDAFKKRRCIIPVSGFYEWYKSKSGSKQPFAIHLKDNAIMSLAGVWEHWKSKESDQEVCSFSIITTEANASIRKIHDRMPVILSLETEDEWLNPNNNNVKALKALLRPCPSSWLESYEISTKVNSPKNNTPELLKPANKTE